MSHGYFAAQSSARFASFSPRDVIRTPLAGRALSCLTLALLTLIPARATAQVSITVVDSNRNPVPAVRIDVMGRGELIAVESTSENGTADLASERWSDVRRLTLSHLAYRTLIVQVDEIPADGVIRLEPQAVAIEGVDVAGRELCPVVESPEARSLWESVAALYSPDTENRALSAILTRHGGGVPETDLYRESTSEGRA